MSDKLSSRWSSLKPSNPSDHWTRSGNSSRGGGNRSVPKPVRSNWNASRRNRGSRRDDDDLFRLVRNLRRAHFAEAAAASSSSNQYDSREDRDRLDMDLCQASSDFLRVILTTLKSGADEYASEDRISSNDLMADGLTLVFQALPILLLSTTYESNEKEERNKWLSCMSRSLLELITIEKNSVTCIVCSKLSCDQINICLGSLKAGILDVSLKDNCFTIHLLCLLLQFDIILENLERNSYLYDVVLNYLLPILEKDEGLFYNLNSKQNEINFSKETILDCISKILSNALRGSALIEPIILDVLETGEEETIQNPIKVRLTMIFDDIFGSGKNVSTTYFDCFSNMIDCIARTSSTFDCEFDVGGTLRAIHFHLGEYMSRAPHKSNTDAIAYLKLLISISRALPKSIIPAWHLFLPEFHNNSFAKCTNSPKLLDLIAPMHSEVLRRHAFFSIECLVNALPLKIWMRSTSNRMTMKQRNPNVRHLHDRIRSAINLLLKGLIQTMFSDRKFCESNVFEACLNLCLALIQNLPYSENDTTLLSPSMKLIECCFSWINCDAIMESNHKRLLAFVFSVIGGDEMQNGRHAPLSLPVKLVLDQNMGFHLELEREILSSKSARRQSESFELFARIFRVAPWIFQKVTHFEDIVRKGLDSDNIHTRRTACIMLHYLLVGRKKEWGEPEVKGSDWEAIVNFVCPTLLQLCSDLDFEIRKTAISSLGTLIGSDWAKLLPASDNYLSSLLSFCLDDHYDDLPYRKIRILQATALKSTGDFISELFEYYYGDTYVKLGPEIRIVDLSRRISKFLENLLSINLHPFVRSKAIYAVGNLAFSMIQRSNKEYLFPVETYLSLLNYCFSLCDDDDEKVSAASIRAIGHLGLGFFVVCDREEYIGWKAEESRVLFFAVESLSKLTRNIDLALDLSENDRSKCTWKQKLFIDKCARGSAFSLANLINICAYRESFLWNVRSALSSLQSCIINCCKLNRKVFSAVLDALNDIEWKVISRGEGDVVSCLLFGCINFLIDPPETFKDSKRTTIAINQLFNQVMQSANETHLVSLLSNPCFSDKCLHFLFAWMINRSPEDKEIATAFENVLRKQYVTNGFEVTLLQRLLSRLSLNQKQKMIATMEDFQMETSFNGEDEL